MTGRETREASRGDHEFVVVAWAGPLTYERYETLAAYTTNDPNTVVVQQDVHGTSSTT